MEKRRKRSGRGRKSLVALAAAALSTPAVGAGAADHGDPSGEAKAGATGEAQQLDGQRKRTNTIFSKPSDTGTPSADLPDGEGKRGIIIIDGMPGESEAQDVTPEATQPVLKSKSLGGVAPPEGGAPKK